ncbi:MAG: PCRF domain-containing protein [Anaerolineae bacterium]
MADRSQIDRARGAIRRHEFWNDTRNAQVQMQKLSRLREDVAKWRSIQTRIKDAIELTEIADESMAADLQAETADLEKLVGTLNFEAMMSGPYDDEDAILSIHAGAGGTECAKGLGANAAADVLALGGTAQIQGRDYRSDGRRGSGHQEREL